MLVPAGSGYPVSLSYRFVCELMIYGHVLFVCPSMSWDHTMISAVFFSVSSNSLIVPEDISLHFFTVVHRDIVSLTCPAHSDNFENNVEYIGGCHVRRGRSMRDELSQQHTSLRGTYFCL